MKHAEYKPGRHLWAVVNCDTGKIFCLDSIEPTKEGADWGCCILKAEGFGEHRPVKVKLMEAK